MIILNKAKFDKIWQNSGLFKNDKKNNNLPKLPKSFGKVIIALLLLKKKVSFLR